MKARRIKGVKRGARLDDAMQRTVAVRLDELCSFMPAAADPDATAALHDLRIAAKRLRYVLEVTAFCFGPYAARAAKRTKELQDLLGEIHDCDVLAPRVRALGEELRAGDVAALVDRAGAAGDLDFASAASAPHADAWRGLQTVSLHLRARRELLHDRFLELWRDLEREGFRARLEYAITERPQPPGSIDVEEG